MRSCAILLTVARVGWNKPGSVMDTSRKDGICEFDVIRLADIVVSSTPERDPVQFSKQWPELFIYILSY